MMPARALRGRTNFGRLRLLGVEVVQSILVRLSISHIFLEMSYQLIYVSHRDPLIEYFKQLVRDYKSIEAGLAQAEKLYNEHYDRGKDQLPSSGHRRLASFSDKIHVESTLTKVIPKLEKIRFFTPLKIVEALQEYDAKYSLRTRRYINITFREIRHLLNTAQIHAIAPSVKLITLDADGTLYEDGANFESDNPIKTSIIRLLQLRKTLHIAIITAAGYHHDATRYEQRFGQLIKSIATASNNSSAVKSFSSSSSNTTDTTNIATNQNQEYKRTNSSSNGNVLLDASEDIKSRFFIMGGECNYCFTPSNKKSLIKPDQIEEGQLGSADSQNKFEDCGIDASSNSNVKTSNFTDPATNLDELEGKMWMTDELKMRNEEDVQKFLKEVENLVSNSAKELHLDWKYKFIKKPFAIGYVPLDPNNRGRGESCDEIVLRIRNELKPPFRFCAFHSNGQIWVDIGNKSLGVKVFQQMTQSGPHETIHIGDQWTETGNDIAARKTATSIWVVKPKETRFFLDLLANDFEKLLKS